MVKKVRQGIIQYEPSVCEGNVDFASIDRFGLSPERLGEYCHVVIDEEIDGSRHGNIYVLKKGDVKDLDEDVDLSSFKVQQSLEPEIWKSDGTMDSGIRLQLMKIADDFIKTLKMDWVKPKDVVLTGSLANYNWSTYSDFDLHILIDFQDVDDRTDFVKDYFDAKKKDWNTKHGDITIHDFPVEIYVQDTNEEHTASGIYSIWENKWLKRPEGDRWRSLKLDKPLIVNKCEKYIKAIDKLVKRVKHEDDDYKLRKYEDTADKILEKLKNGRREGLMRSGEMSPYNIIFKAMRRFGYIEKLINLKNDIYNKVNSIQQ